MELNKFDAWFHGLRDQLVFREDDRAANFENSKGRRSEMRDGVAHVVNMLYGRAKSYALAWEKRAELKYLLGYVRTMKTLGESHMIGELVQASRREWGIINRTISTCHCLERYGLCDQIGNQEVIEAQELDESIFSDKMKEELFL